MSHTPDYNPLVHCDSCGEDYSATYRRCPFCGNKSDPWSTASIPRITEDYQDEYRFDGGDLFDPTPPSPKPRKSKGGKRLAQKQKGINWVRTVTIFCALIILVSTVVILSSLLNPIFVADPDETTSPSISDTPSPSPTVTNPVIIEIVDSNETEKEEPTGTESPTPDSEEDLSSPTPIAATGITLNKDEFLLAANESFTIKATVAPEDWTGTLTWTSSNNQIATVSNAGTVTNVNKSNQALSVTITVTTSDGITATAKVYCRGGSASELTLNKTDFTLILGKDSTFTMKVTSDHPDVTWSISDTSVATIDENGKVTAVSAGTATITATTPDGTKTTCIVRVRAS